MQVFDIMGPVMIGPSSSHTAGAARLGFAAQALLGAPPVKALVELHGSFAKTYRGHGTDRAIVAGILGFRPDDERLRDSFRLAQERGLQVEFTTVELEDTHPNTARITLWDAQEHSICMQGASVGGGSIHISFLNGMRVDASGANDTLIVLHRDLPGIIAEVSNFLSWQGINICNFHLSREEKGGQSVMTIETDGSITPQINQQIGFLPNVLQSTLLALH